MEREIAVCALCGHPMPEGEEMFAYHGFSGPCPSEPFKEPTVLREVPSTTDAGTTTPGGSGGNIEGYRD